MKKSLVTSLTAFATAAVLTLGAGSAMAQWKICVDPGHGGSDPGATGNSQEEAANVLDTGLRLRTWMNEDTADTGGGTTFAPIMTRTTDTYVSLSGRTSYANSNSASRFMSIHNNAFASSSANGIETYAYTSGSANSFDLRNKVQEEAISMWPLTNRGNKTAGFYVIRYTSMPAELHEMAFITNSTDASYLGSSTERDNHAKSELFAIQRHLGYSKYTPSTAVVETADNGTADWSSSASWFSGSYSAGYYGSNYHARATAATSDAATWTVNLPSSGTYRVDAWWAADTNRSTSAPYIVYHSGGSSTVSVNQQVNGGQWNSLGNYSFNSGNREVKLSCWTGLGYFVIGDAVRFTKI